MVTLKIKFIYTFMSWQILLSFGEAADQIKRSLTKKAHIALCLSYLFILKLCMMINCTHQVLHSCNFFRLDKIISIQFNLRENQLWVPYPSKLCHRAKVISSQCQAVYKSYINKCSNCLCKLTDNFQTANTFITAIYLLNQFFILFNIFKMLNSTSINLYF